MAIESLEEEKKRKRKHIYLRSCQSPIKVSGLYEDEQLPWSLVNKEKWETWWTIDHQIMNDSVK